MSRYDYYFHPFKVGDLTDKWKIDDLFFLQFGNEPGCYRSDYPEGKGLLMATIDKRDYTIGELKKIEHKANKL